MAATARSDPYAIFIRKIGYSVGLERTLERLTDLENIYRENQDITPLSWNELVRGTAYWKLKTENIKDVFYSLRLIHYIGGDVIVLENLDAVAIASSLSKNENERNKVRAFLLLWAILVNDGEIFVNLMLADFKHEQIKETLTAMLLQKRSELLAIFPGKESKKRISRVITVERQETNKGSDSAGRSVSSIKRTEPLQSKFKIISKDSDDIVLSDDYLRKVPPRRKDWARSLGLWDDEYGLTQRGKKFIEGLANAGYINSKGLFTYWPMAHELIRAGFRRNLLGKDAKSLWDCLVDFGAAYAGLNVKPSSDNDATSAVELIGAMMTIFRSLHVRKTMLRRELPITVAYPAAIACACATQKPVLDLPAAIKEEQEGEKRRLIFRQSRNTGGALSLK